MTNYQWRYNFTGNNLGSIWRNVNYDDSVAGWQTGRGVFALETDNQLVISQTNTIMPLTGTSGSRMTTYYFRTHFNLTNDPYQVVVVLTNLIDDGAVFYVNGIEIGRLNMPAFPAPITYITTATTAGEAVYTFLNIPYQVLVRGDNVLQVEVHNGSGTSSDVVFGLAASVAQPAVSSPLVITNQPKDVTSLEGPSVSFSVGVSGFPITYAQWFLNGTPILGADRLIYAITNVHLEDAGTYTLIVSNSLGSALSAPAILSVAADTNSPTILDADGSDSSTDVVLTFSEGLLAVTATNIANYTVTNIGGGTLSVIRAVLASNGSNVTLTTSAPRIPNTNYLVIVNNIRDASPRTNMVAPNLSWPISTSIQLIDEYSFWYYYNPFVTVIPPGPGDDNPDLGISWRQPDYLVNQATNDFWGDNEFNPGAFFYGTDVPAEKGAELSASLAPVVYFRAPVYFVGSPLGAQFDLDYLMKEGGVVYSGGKEILRINLRAGEVSWDTRALEYSTLAWKSGFTKSTLGLEHGWNTVSAELHSRLTPQTNMAFALRLRARAGSLATGPVVITTQPASQTILESASATFSIMGAGPGWFQWYRDGVAIPGATNPVYTIPSVPLSLDGSRFFVVAWNETSSSTSSNALLTVQQDFTPPKLLGAYALSSNQILVSFSKPLDPTSAANALNYVPTNGVGPNLVIGSITITNGTNILLEATGGSGSKPYVLVVNNVQDTTSVGNTIAPNSAATVGLKLSIPIDAAWKYDASGTDLGSAWRNVGYDDASWPIGTGLLHNETAPLPAPKNTVLPLQSTNGASITTFYFRKHLSLPGGATNATLILNHVIDDGVMFYLNGNEIHRFNMPNGPISWNTFANVSVGDAAYSGPFTITLNNLLSGENIISAEVHQLNGTSNDICFGADLSITSPSLPLPTAPAPIRVGVTRSGGVTQLTWIGTGLTLQKASTLTGTNTVWQDVNGASSPYTLTPSNAAAFFRLKKN